MQLSGRTSAPTRRRAALLAASAALAGCADEAPAPLAGPAGFAVRGRWPGEPSLTFAVERDDAPIGGDAFVRAVERAAAVWTATGVVALRPAAAGETADVTLGWRRGHHGACLPFGPGADVAHAGPVRRGTFVHFDLGRQWSERGDDGVSVFHTAMHELGHVLGLGHCEAPEAVMGTDPARPAALSMHDLAGLWSLYGGGGDDASDLLVRRGTGGVGAALRRVAPPDRCGHAVFDCDGDGRCEVVVWRTDAAGHGAVTIYRFSSTLLLDGTLGPFHGAVAPGAEVGFCTGPAAERLLVTAFPGGRRVVRQFDGHGVPGIPVSAPSPELLAGASRPTAGDIDGDGQAETVERPEG